MQIMFSVSSKYVIHTSKVLEHSPTKNEIEILSTNERMQVIYPSSELRIQQMSKRLPIKKVKYLDSPLY